MNQFYRSKLLYGENYLDKLKDKCVAIFGIGGVGGYVLEALCRAGVGNFILVDNDCVDITNLNRQIIATHSSLGKSKVEVALKRALDINPHAHVEIRKEFFDASNSNNYDFKKIDYVVDAIDSVASKLELITKCKENDCRIISSMGMGNKRDPSKVLCTDINKTEMDPLAKVIRQELRKRGISKLKVVYSKEKPIDCKAFEGKKKIIASNSIIPAIGGLNIANEVINDLLGE